MLFLYNSFKNCMSSICIFAFGWLIVKLLISPCYTIWLFRRVGYMTIFILWELLLFSRSLHWSLHSLPTRGFCGHCVLLQATNIQKFDKKYTLMWAIPPWKQMPSDLSLFLSHIALYNIYRILLLKHTTLRSLVHCPLCTSIHKAKNMV